jgi:WhiB family redox-sensing transcriptional regulator
MGLQGRDWRQLAACAKPGVDPELFFSSERGKERQAKRICANCPVKAPCLADALARPPNADFGIYGGTNPRQRGQIRRWADHQRPYRSPMSDPALAAQAFELARRIGTPRAAEQLGVDTSRLYRAWDQWHLGRPNWRGRTLPVVPELDPLEAQRAFMFAQQVGLAEAAERLGYAPGVLKDAWQRWGLGNPEARAAPRRRGPEARPDTGARTRRLDQPTRPDVAAPIMRRPARARSGTVEEREL